MRLCKEDNVPDAVICRRVATPEGQRPFVPALPKTLNAVSESAAAVAPEARGDPCLFQGSIGTAYN